MGNDVHLNLLPVSQDFGDCGFDFEFCPMDNHSWYQITKRIPELGDVIEGRYVVNSDGLKVWHVWQGNFAYGVVVGIEGDAMKVHTYSGVVEVCGEFTGRVERDNSQCMRKGSAIIWVPVPLGRTAKGHLVNMPSTGFSVLVEKPE